MLQVSDFKERERIHVSFDLSNNRIDQLKITDKHIAESFSHFSMKPGEILSEMLEYSYVKNFVYATEQGADVVIRINPMVMMQLLNFIEPDDKSHLRLNALRKN